MSDTNVLVGDKGIAYAAGSQFSQFSPVTTPEVGNKVILIEIGDGSKIAVPILEFDIGQYTWVIPEFRFAGFDWKIDWKLLLLTFNRWPNNYRDHDFKITFTSGGTYYGDSPITPSGGCEKITDDPQAGDIEYAFTDGAFESYPLPDDVSVCVAAITGGLEWWVMAAPNFDYGAYTSATVYFFNEAVWAGSLAPAQGHPGLVLGHGTWYPS